MSWLAKYKSRFTSADDAVKDIESGQRVFLAGNCSVPQKLLGALLKRGKKLKDVEIMQALTVGPAPHADPALEGAVLVELGKPTDAVPLLEEARERGGKFVEAYYQRALSDKNS